MHVCAGTHSNRGGGQLSVLAGLTQELVSEVASEMRQKEFRSNSLLQTDGKSDFGELTTTVREDRVSQKRGFLVYLLFSASSMRV